MTSKKENPVCLRCSGHMELGYVPVDVGNLDWFESFWMRGKPKRRRILPRFSASNSVSNQPDEPKLAIDVYRCNICGWLDYYANNPLPRNGN